jgi:hypothetical protein
MKLRKTRVRGRKGKDRQANLNGLLPEPVLLSPAELSGREIEGTAKDCLTFTP